MDYRAELGRAAAHVHALGYTPIYLAVYGSQNYGLSLDTAAYRSDLDFKCIVLPSLRDLVEGKRPVSLTVETHEGQIDIKDIRVFMEAVCKMNPAYLECLATPNCLMLKHGQCLMEMRALLPELLAQRGAAFAHACRGLFMQKERQMCHPFPAAMEKIRAYGYDGKQVHHMYRLLRMLQTFAQTGEMQLTAPQDARALLMDLKLGGVSLDDARAMIEGWKPELEAVVSRIEREYAAHGGEAAQRMTDLMHEAMLAYCRYEVRNDEYSR